jgi:HlyD family secretion protein
VQIDGTIPDVRPGFTCTAEITTATRKQVISVPIQAMTVRELLYDARATSSTNSVRHAADSALARPNGTSAGPGDLKPGEKREEKEGVFLMKDGKSTFAIVKTGIAGERYLEALSG